MIDVTIKPMPRQYNQSPKLLLIALVFLFHLKSFLNPRPVALPAALSATRLPTLPFLTAFQARSRTGSLIIIFSHNSNCILSVLSRPLPARLPADSIFLVRYWIFPLPSVLCSYALLLLSPFCLRTTNHDSRPTTSIKHRVSKQPRQNKKTCPEPVEGSPPIFEFCFVVLHFDF